jgi:predicted O-methyltransferase YrrM
MIKIDIKKKLENIGVSLDTIMMGDFDMIGKFTAERSRGPDHPLYKTAGCFYRSNYERGILIYHLIKQYKISSMLEIGFGRGYSTFCAAKAFSDFGINGKIVTIDPGFDQKYLSNLRSIFPKKWFDYVTFMNGTSRQVLPSLKDSKFDFVYIDGDHSYEETKFDWENTKDLWEKCLLFDDYHLPDKNDPGIQCQKLIDEIQDESKELIIMDRRMFPDDRGFTDEQVNYGQVLITNPQLFSFDSW